MLLPRSSSSSSASAAVGPCSPFITETFTVQGDSVVVGVRHKNIQNAVVTNKGNAVIDKNETSKLKTKASKAPRHSVYFRTPGQVALRRSRECASKTAKRRRAAEIKDTPLENRTPEESKLLQATEQARTRKNADETQSTGHSSQVA
jgi:hypothetical protein